MITSKENRFPASNSPPTRSRSSTVYWIAAGIALLGLADATFLTVAHLTGDDAVCGSFAGCSTVLGSAYATIKGIPTAAFGALAYFAVFSAAILAAFWLYAGARLSSYCGRGDVHRVPLLPLSAGFCFACLLSLCLFSAAMTFLLAGLLIAVPTTR